MKLRVTQKKEEIEVPDNGAAQIVVTIVIVVVVVVDVEPVSIKVASIDPSARGRPKFCSLPSEPHHRSSPYGFPRLNFIRESRLAKLGFFLARKRS